MHNNIFKVSNSSQAAAKNLIHQLQTIQLSLLKGREEEGSIALSLQLRWWNQSFFCFFVFLWISHYSYMFLLFTLQHQTIQMSHWLKWLKWLNPRLAILVPNPILVPSYYNTGIQFGIVQTAYRVSVQYKTTYQCKTGMVWCILYQVLWYGAAPYRVVANHGWTT